MSEPAPPPPDWLRAEARRLYGSDPVAYEAGRPEYPDRVYEVLVDRCGLGSTCRVLEIGPGTGRVTQRALELGADVVGVEPDATLADYLLKRFAGKDLQVVVGLFEDVPLSEDAFDLVLSAMSFHWVDQAIGLPKLGRVVRRGGWVALWWTVFGDRARPDPFYDRTATLLGEGVGASGTRHKPMFELDVEQRRLELENRAGLVDVDGELIRWTACMSTDQLRALYSSMIRILCRPPSEQQHVLDSLVAIANDEFGGVVERPFVTALYTARRA